MTKGNNTLRMTTQSGRSMVEMLGTLAIIGVLSVGAIAGYSYGMNKYRANQTMHDISLRTVDLMTQASQGRTELSLAEWDKETTIYDFANPAYVEGENLIAFDVGTTKKIPQSVCQMVFDGLANTAAQIDINESVATSKDSCDEDNTMTFYFASGGNTSVDNNTGGGTTGEQCGDTVCGTCQKCENESCVPVANYEQKCTTSDNKTGWCVSGTCQPEETCNCGPNQYCADTNESATEPNSSDVCVDVDFYEYMIDDTTYYVSNSTMSWWDAQSACKALGNKKMANSEDFVIKWNGKNDWKTYTLTNLGNVLKNNGRYDLIWTSHIYTAGYAYSFFGREQAIVSGGLDSVINDDLFNGVVCK